MSERDQVKALELLRACLQRLYAQQSMPVEDRELAESIEKFLKLEEGSSRAAD